MFSNPESAAFILKQAEDVLQNNEPDVLKLERLWHTLTSNRARINASLLRNTVGPQIIGGPFKNMKMTPESMNGLFGPYLTGSYEHELHGVFENVMAQPYKCILNIGCAFGYYAVGLALRMPDVKVFAFDIEEKEQKRCRDMAELNSVSDRVSVAGEFRGEDFAAHAHEKTLVIVDIEGAEVGLLNPGRYPALMKLDVIVELHDAYNESISKMITQRFAPTHDIEIIYNKPVLFDFTLLGGPDYYVHPMDSLAITWENRSGPTPWAFMRAR